MQRLSASYVTFASHQAEPERFRAFSDSAAGFLGGRLHLRSRIGFKSDLRERLASPHNPKYSCRGPRRQVSALPYIVGPNGAVQVLLITTRAKHSWILPKGWPMKRFSPAAAAAQEAHEEAGVDGLVWATPIGSYRYRKGRDSDGEAIEVDVYPLEVTDQLETWPEKDQRQRGWFTLADAMQSPLAEHAASGGLKNGPTAISCPGLGAVSPAVRACT